MERMDESIALVDRAGRSHQRLAGHLSTEHPLSILVGRVAAEDVHLDRFEVEQPDEVVQRRLLARRVPG